MSYVCVSRGVCCVVNGRKRGHDTSGVKTDSNALLYTTSLIGHIENSMKSKIETFKADVANVSNAPLK